MPVYRETDGEPGDGLEVRPQIMPASRFVDVGNRLQHGRRVHQA